MHQSLYIPLLLTALPISAQQSNLFDYDRSAPLDYQETLISTHDGARVYDSSYASPKGGRVRAYTVVPDRKGRFAGIVWQHGGGQNRNWFLPDAIALARAGAISILMDAPSNRPPGMRGPISKDDAENFQHEMIQVLVDARRAYDVLAARPEVDKDRIGYAGLSFGAMMGGSLAGTDPRFKTFILICGLEGFARHYRLSQHPGIVQFRNNLKPEEFQKLLAAAEPIDAKNFIGKSSPRPLLFQAARFDPGVSESDTRDYFAMAGEPKQLKWYDSGHDLNDPQAFANRQAWFRKYLTIK
jgi:cephalosporin-C deacetylase-like acetyl esterase